MVTSPVDTAEFVDRMRWCVSKTGSVYALAKKIGVFPNTIRGYLRKSEPSRPLLVAIARECGVSIEWLATGSDRFAPEGYVKNSTLHSEYGR